MYKQQPIFIATMHGKEQVIAPFFKQEFQAEPFVSSSFDTDQFGTFTKEIERIDNPLETLRKKCNEGHQFSSCPVIVASEGSFGPHPSMPFTNANEEIVMLKDFKSDIEVTGKYLSTSTNLFEKEIKSEIDFSNALAEIGFPDHGVIIRDINQDKVLLKSEKDLSVLSDFVTASIQKGISLSVSSDMRAFFNPTRMQNIEKATEDLIQKLKVCCPSCETPGFAVVEVKPGLPCGQCGLPTRSTLYRILRCQKCNKEEFIKFPNNIKTENPMYCDFCNP
jgi:hypothetical protein